MLVELAAQALDTLIDRAVDRVGGIARRKAEQAAARAALLQLKNSQP